MTKTEETPAERKAEIIKLLASAIDKNTANARQVWCIIHALQDACEFIEDKRYQYRNDLPFEIRCMRECLEENLDYVKERKGILISLFDNITDALQAAIMIAGENAEGLIAITSPQLRDDLHSISDYYNG